MTWAVPTVPPRVSVGIARALTAPGAAWQMAASNGAWWAEAASSKGWEECVMRGTGNP